MTLARKTLGRQGEDAAARYLSSKGYAIIETNWRYGRGEIDLIVKKAAVLVFVEVKAGSGRGFGPPEARVDIRKQRQIGRVAQGYLAQSDWQGDCRFDVVAVTGAPGHWEIRHFEDAFWLAPENE